MLVIVLVIFVFVQGGSIVGNVCLKKYSNSSFMFSPNSQSSLWRYDCLTVGSSGQISCTPGKFVGTFPAALCSGYGSNQFNILVL